MSKIPKVLTIAGSDCSGGAGIQADLKTFSALGCYGMSAITALTAQNTLGVQSIYPVSGDFLDQQLRSIFEDTPPDAVKIGMVGDLHSITTIAAILDSYGARNIVLDPVMVATSGDKLISEEAIEALSTYLVPIADLITPNIHEAEILGSEDAKLLREKTGAKAVLVKGGHAQGQAVIDVLATAEDVYAFEAPRLATKNTHGTGCTLSSAIAAHLAKGHNLHDAVAESKTYITEAIRNADTLNVGAGAGPVHHFYDMWK